MTITEAFVNRALFRLIVITCNTTTEDARGQHRQPRRRHPRDGQASQLPAGIDESALCTLPGANYDNLTRGNYSPSVELPDIAPLFP